MSNYKITVTGLVQGIGYRPFVCKLANEYGLSGSVKNTDGIVTILASGAEVTLADFVSYLKENVPSGGRIDGVEIEPIDSLDSSGFSIVESDITGTKKHPVLPADIATCEKCEAELKDANNRRYMHPFISCVACGPRYTVIEDKPYDRLRLTLKDFELCDECANEYSDAGDRRCFAQTISCKKCGPQLNMSIDDAAEFLNSGNILAIKDIGGFHLACRLGDETAINKLRVLKGRPSKPFAVMYSSVDEIRKVALVNDREEALLKSEARPIVLLELIDPASTPDGSNSAYVGAMLPCNPVQIMLVEKCGPLIMTSANTSGGLMITEASLMEEWIELRCDKFDLAKNQIKILDHNRKIEAPLDDSILRVVNDRVLLVRRARGYVPLPLELPETSGNSNNQILAMGGDLKATFSYATEEGAVYMEPTLSDLADDRCLSEYNSELRRMRRLFDFEPELVVVDKHPNYLSRVEADKYVRENKDDESSIVEVQHHKAHVATVVAEHNLKGKILGFAFDGTGYGEDGAIWGSECFEVDTEANEFTRVDHLPYVALVASDEASKNCKMSLMSYVFSQSKGNEKIELSLMKAFDINKEDYTLTKSSILAKINRVNSSSMGRLFDAVAAALGVCEYNSYEGEAAMELEYLAAKYFNVNGDATIAENRNLKSIDSLFLDMAKAIEAGVDKGRIALEFHYLIADFIHCIAKEHNISQIALSGGTFLNRILLNRTFKILEEDGYLVYINEQVSCGDGGLALGQIYIGEHLCV